QRPLLRRAFPSANQNPKDKDPDADGLMTWFMGYDDPQDPETTAIGGPLYPPIHAVIMVPLAWLPPQPAYRTAQILTLFWAFLAGWGVRLLTQGRIWWPMAAAAIIAYPGFGGSIDLGQNAVLTL